MRLDGRGMKSRGGIHRKREGIEHCGGGVRGQSGKLSGLASRTSLVRWHNNCKKGSRRNGRRGSNRCRLLTRLPRGRG